MNEEAKKEMRSYLMEKKREITKSLEFGELHSIARKQQLELRRSIDLVLQMMKEDEFLF